MEIKAAGGAGRLPPLISLPWGYHTNQGAKLMLAEDDVLRLYAKLNAHDHIITALLTTAIHLSDDPGAALESLREATMDRVDRQQIASSDPNPDLARKGLLLTLQMAANAFDQVKGGLAPPA